MEKQNESGWDSCYQLVYGLLKYARMYVIYDVDIIHYYLDYYLDIYYIIHYYLDIYYIIHYYLDIYYIIHYY
jgi:hypothetical protein